MPGDDAGPAGPTRIRSKADLLRFLDEDRRALGVGGWKARVLDDIWRWERLLRRLEHLTNCGGNAVVRTVVLLRFRRLSRALGFTIPPNTFGPGLSIAHRGTIIVNRGASIGARCRIHADVNIGATAGSATDAPTIGDDVYIGPGAKLFGPITLGDRVRIGANAVVNRSFGSDTTLVGVPARAVEPPATGGGRAAEPLAPA